MPAPSSSPVEALANRDPRASLTPIPRDAGCKTKRDLRPHRSQGAVPNRGEPLHDQALKVQLYAGWTNAWTTSAYYRPT